MKREQAERRSAPVKAYSVASFCACVGVCVPV